ncbi:MAG TPA: amidohydrolase family protein [Gaiellaceae bacterium]|jgi:hypothetical protein|nr:amidohydrolase family protein [Gaiellaceae bacterium]
MLIDCDVHNEVPSTEALLPYLDAHWQEYVSRSAFKGPEDTAYPPGAPTTRRPGASEGSELAQVRDEVLGEELELAILTCVYGADSIHNPYLAAAMAGAVNDWQIENWLDGEPRVRGSVVVPAAQPELAAAEIDRVGAHPGFVQVLLPVRSNAPYGTRAFHPLYEAATRNGLAVALHFGGCPSVPPTASGWPSYYIEEHAGMATVFQTQLQSLLVEGVFDRFPEFRLVLAESGFAWLPAFLWRLDKEWKGLRREVPWMRRPPSAYVADSVRVTMQPLDCPLELVPRVLDRLGSPELLLYSSDYPHGHLEPAGSVLSAVPAELRAGVEAGNARSFYGLGD